MSNVIHIRVAGIMQVVLHFNIYLISVTSSAGASRGATPRALPDLLSSDPGCPPVSLQRWILICDLGLQPLELQGLVTLVDFIQQRDSSLLFPEWGRF